MHSPTPSPGPAIVTSVARSVGLLPPGPLTTAELAAAVPDPRERERYVRIWHGVYRRDDQVDDLRLRSEALARIWPEGVLRGRSAALLWGDDSAPPGAPPEIWLPATRRSREGRVYRYGAMPSAAVTEVGGLRVTTPLRTCRDLACDLGPEDAVVAVERMCAAIPGLAGRLAAATAHPSGRGARRFANVAAAIDRRSVSAESSRARLRLAAAGFDGFRADHRIRIDGRELALPLADPALRCAVVVPGASPVASPGRSSGAGTSPAAGAGAERHLVALCRAGWTILVVRGPSAPANACRPQVGTVPSDAGGVLPALRSWWPGTTLLPPLLGEPVADPLGIWAVRSA